MVIISVVDHKICINGHTFGVHQLRESKEYLQRIGAEEAVFTPEDDDELNELHSIVERMEKASPEASGEDALSYYLN